jgi:hypothetical protein
MPWQRLVADVGGEIDPATGLPAYREVILTVPRQSGKTTLVLSWEVQRALGWGKPQRIVYSAQTGNDARKKLIEDQVPILEPRKAKLGISSILRGMGNEAVVWKNGSRLVLLASSEDSGHGKTVNFAVKDELFADADNRRDQALVPAMNTVADGQVLTTSTAGTDASVALNAAVARGRESVRTNQRNGVAYFEWSFGLEDDIDDPEVWWANMPALGYTITEDVVRHARMALPEGEFRRAYGNLSTVADDRVIPGSVWDLVNSSDARPEGPLVFAVDVNPERTAAAIVAVDPQGVGEVIEHRDGTGWLLEEVDRLEGRHHPKWAVDGNKNAPVASFLPEVRRRVSQLEEVTELPAACGRFFDWVADRKVKFRRHADLDAAVAGADRRFSGDGWTWARRGAVDITPLVAMTIGEWVAVGGESVYEGRGLVTLG